MGVEKKTDRMLACEWYVNLSEAEQFTYKQVYLKTDRHHLNLNGEELDILYSKRDEWKKKPK